MQSNGKEFQLILHLPRGKYEYKFIVNGDWRWSPEEPTVKDDIGNVNNIIDTTKIEDQSNSLMMAHHGLKGQEMNNQDEENLPMIPNKMDIISPYIKHQKSIDKMDLEKQPKINNEVKNYKWSDKAPPCPQQIKTISFIQEKERKNYFLWHKKLSNDEESEIDTNDDEAYNNNENHSDSGDNKTRQMADHAEALL